MSDTFEVVPWSTARHVNNAHLHPHVWLTWCIRRACRTRVNPDGPGICPACIADLRRTS